MTDLDARKGDSRFSGWTNVIAGVLLIVLYTAVSPVWSDPDRVGRLLVDRTNELYSGHAILRDGSA